MPDASVRASDAERGAIADTLSLHYSEGRLEREEFDDRLRRAMSAKTRGDLAPLLADLPATAVATRPAKSGRIEHRAREIALTAAAVAVAALLAILLIGQRTAAIVVAAIALYYVVRKAQRARARRVWHDHLHEHGTPHWHGSRGKVKL